MIHYPLRNIKVWCTAILTSGVLIVNAQDKQHPQIDVQAFADNAGHWYGIKDAGNMINAREGRPKYKPTDLEEIGDNILLFQKSNGGWPKNYDIMAVLTPDQKDSVAAGRNELHTTYDNGTTYTHIAALAGIYDVTGKNKYRDGAIKGLEYVIASQYGNGGWPQYYPLENNYSRCITYNDDAYIGIMELLKDVADHKPKYGFIAGKLRSRLQVAYDKGMDCLLKTQINDAGKPTAWCQQYNEVTLEPAWARKFEPPSISNGESTNIVLFLMGIDHPSPRVIDAVQNAVVWFQDSEILHTRTKRIQAPRMVTPFRVSNTDVVVVDDPAAPPIWTRYYELKTHKPLFCNRDSKVVYSLAEVARERRDGYGWYTYGPQKVLNQYPEWQKQWAPDKNMIR